MERWKEEYSFEEHLMFISTHTTNSSTPAFGSAITWELQEASKEADKVNERMGRGRVGR
jgi:hypothetical protein